MDYTVTSYLIYLVISLRITVWVGRTLFEHGRVFLVDSFHGNEPLADSINHLLLVGFYLVNVGYVSLMLQAGHHPESLRAMLEFLSYKLGLVLVVLGGLHFTNVYVINRFRAAALEDQAVPPVAPDGHVKA